MSRSDWWTPAEEELARTFYYSPLNDEAFRQKVGRTRESYKSRMRYKKANDGDAADKLRMDRGGGGRPTAEMLEDARRRLLARSPVQELLGDPAPGYSVLDKRVSS
jgi:hypothetical protein